MEKTTFQEEKVKQRLAGYVRLKYQAERPGEAGTKEVLEYFGARGLPTYTILTTPGPQ